MKTKILLRAALLSAMLISGTMVFSQDTTAQRILGFIDSNLGKRIESGMCGQIVLKAYGKKLYAHTYKESKCKVRVPKPGDMIEFTNTTFCKNNDGKPYTLSSHIGIVYHVYENGDITYADNWGEGRTVTISNMNYKKIEKGTITFYRADYALINK